MNQLKRIGALLVPAAMAALVLAGRAPSAFSAPGPNVPIYRPDREQLVDYDQALEAWKDARKARDAKHREKNYKCAESHFIEALDGPSRFPEALLGLGALNYELNRTYTAERSFGDAAQISRGGIKVEALTYLGVIALRSRNWSGARNAFTSAEAEDLGLTHASLPNSESRRTVADFRARAERLRPARRLGIALATYYMSVDPASPAPNQASYEASLAAIEDLMRANVGAVDGKNIALWRFPEMIHPRPKPLPGIPEFPSARADWTLTIDTAPPAGVTPATPEQLGNAVRAYAAGRLEILRTRNFGSTRPGQQPPLPLPDSGALTVTQDRRNAAMALVHRVIWLEEAPGSPPGRMAPDYRGALDALGKLSAYGDIPGVTLMVRQHRIWIALEGMPSLSEAGSLIGGPGGAEDPLIYSEIASYAQQLELAGRRDEAHAQWRKIIQGVPESSNPGVRVLQQKSRTDNRLFAEWNLAVDALNLGGSSQEPAFWQKAFNDFGPAKYREEVRFYIALKWAEAVVQKGGTSGELSAALGNADSVVNGRDGGSGLPERRRELRPFAAYLAQLAHRSGRQGMYADALRLRTDYYGAVEAENAAKRYNDVPQRPLDAKDAAQRSLISTLERIIRDYPSLRDELQPYLDLMAANQRENNGVGEVIAKMRLRNEWAQIWDVAAKATTEGNIYPATAEKWGAAADAWDAVRKFQQSHPDLAGLYPSPPNMMSDFEMDVCEVERQLVYTLLQQAWRLRRAKKETEAQNVLQRASAVVKDLHCTKPPVSDRLRYLVNRMMEGGAPRPGSMPGRVKFIPYTGPKKSATPRHARGAILHFASGEWPDVGKWLARLKRGLEDSSGRSEESRALDALVQWFRNGDAARASEINAAGSARSPKEVVRTEWDRQSLYEYLVANVNRTPGVIPPGSIQYGYNGKTGQWSISRIRKGGVGYFLNGSNRLIIHAFCSNVTDLITVTAAGIVPPPTTPDWKRPVPPPEPTYWPAEVPGPLAAWQFPSYEAPKTVTTPVAGPTFPVCPPAFTLLVKAHMPPRMPLPDPLPPHCSPTRITIGRISSIDARNYLIRVEVGTAENRKR